MSLLSDLYIPILPSPDFRRLVWVLTSITVGTLWYAQLPMILSLGLVLTLPWALFTGSRPYPDLETVHFSQKKWQLTFSTKKEIYQKIDIAADTGLFLLCRFSKEKEKKKRWLVIFCDQLSQDQRRALHIIEQIKGVWPPWIFNFYPHIKITLIFGSFIMSSKKQTMGFQTEVKKMLHLVVHSLYSNKEIFLRELISNASDALDKLRFLALSDASLYEQDSDLKIGITFDAKQKTLTITDNGIGMTWDEAVTNLGTIAKSGTEEFISHMTGDQAKDSNLIGQFGVGFYSAFIVADKVILKSRRAGAAIDTAIQWESKGDGEFTIDAIRKESRGTEVTLYLKDDAEEFLSDWRIRGIITKYSDHISWPIVMQEMSQISADEDKKDQKKEEPVFETVNKATALWTQQKSEISDEEYQALYKHISHDFQDPLTWTHNHVEGKHEYISLLYIPAHAPFDLWQHEAKHGLKLYVKRVFIMDDVAQFLPRYLRFVKGIVDASDLPLNVSREILQDNKQVDSIKSACTKRILSALEKMSQDNPDMYQKFWKEFGLVLKEGPVEDFANRETIAKLLRFTSTHSNSEEQTISLADYIARMQDKQDKIYYITAATYNAAKNSPHLEIFKKKGIEVLLLSDRIDEWLTGHLAEFEGKKLQSIAKGKVDLEDDKNEVKKQEESFAQMLKQIKDILQDKIKDVQLTNRLTDSPACIVADENDMGLEMQRILQAAGQKVPTTKPIFEINPDHVLIKRIHGIQDDEKFARWVSVLFEQALIAEGGQLDNPADFVKRVNDLLIEV